MEMEDFLTRVDEITGMTLDISPKVQEGRHKNDWMEAYCNDEEEEREDEADTAYKPPNSRQTEGTVVQHVHKYVALQTILLNHKVLAESTHVRHA